MLKRTDRTEWSQAKILAGIGMVAALVFFYRKKMKRNWQFHQEGLRTEETILRESVTEMLADVNVPDLKQRAFEPGQVADVPPPMRRMRNIGASYVVPRSRIERCTADALSFDIPTLRCFGPLRAHLSRVSKPGPWDKIQLTVDLVAGSEMPPLLTCTRSSLLPAPDESGGTGGTTTPTKVSSGLAANDFPRADVCKPWLSVRNSGGIVVAEIFQRRTKGRLTVQRQDNTTWDVAAHLMTTTPWITISNKGQEIGQATSLGRDGEDQQLDMHPKVQNAESCVLLMCMLAVLVFQQ